MCHFSKMDFTIGKTYQFRHFLAKFHELGYIFVEKNFPLHGSKKFTLLLNSKKFKNIQKNY